jgi:hypothetical protein
VRNVKALIDNRICCSFIDSTDSENIIFCRPFEESIYNISTFTTKDEEFIHSYIAESNTNYIVSDIVLQDGAVYKDVKFRVVVCENNDLPASTINITALGDHSSVKQPYIKELKSIDLLQESASDDVDDSPILIPSIITEDATITRHARELEEQLIIERQRIAEENSKIYAERERLTEDRKLQKTLEDYKSELLTEYYNVGDKQREIISVKLNEAVEELDSSISDRFKAQQLTLLSYLEETTSLNLVDLQESQDKQIVQLKSDISELLTQKINIKSIDVDRMLVERSAELKAAFSNKIITELEVYKRKLSDELSIIAATASNELFTEKSDKLTTIIAEYRDTLDNIGAQTVIEINETVNAFNNDLASRIPVLDDKIIAVTQRIDSLVEEKRDVQVIAESAKKYTDSQIIKVSEDIKNYARRILDLGGGGGSVAVQYAKGGTMDGDLNVTGQYLSAGVNISTLFGTGGGSGDAAVNSLVRSNSGDWNSAYTTATAYQTASGNWQSTFTTVNSNSANWSSAFNISTAYQNISSSYATYNFVNTNFFNLTGGIISGATRINNNLTVFGNLTATGTTTFANTVFSVTSALSVVHFGSGPALWVGNNGDGDIASFYDTDQGVEVLHVGGNNGSFPNVGVKTSTPNADFTVNGQISANNTIWSASGNSNQWNSAFTTVNTNSANWQNASDALDFIIINTNFNAIVNRQYLVDTLSSNVVGTLPLSPAIGDNISFVDSNNTWGTYPLILNNNGNLLQTYNEPLTANISGYQFKIVYIGGSYGWKIV